MSTVCQPCCRGTLLRGSSVFYSGCSTTFGAATHELVRCSSWQPTATLLYCFQSGTAGELQIKTRRKAPRTSLLRWRRPLSLGRRQPASCGAAAAAPPGAPPSSPSSTPLSSFLSPPPPAAPLRCSRSRL